MTIDTECQRLTGSFRATRDRRRFCDAGGSRLMSLTLGKAIGRQRTHAADLAELRLAFDCNADPAFSPVTAGRGRYPGGHYARYPLPSRRLEDFRKPLVTTSGFLALAIAAGLWFASPVHAQETQIIQPGSMAVTGFSGTIIPDIEDGLPPGVDPVDETFIDTERATLRVFDVSALGGPPAGQLVNTPAPFEVLASQIGQVFGVTYDDGIRDGAPVAFRTSTPRRPRCMASAS